MGTAAKVDDKNKYCNLSEYTINNIDNKKSINEKWMDTKNPVPRAIINKKAEIKTETRFEIILETKT
jgi:hypothetical protein